MSSEARVLKTLFRVGGSWAEEHSSEKTRVTGVPLLATTLPAELLGLAHQRPCGPGLHPVLAPS